MTTQILDIVVYSHDGRRRELQLKVGTVNIVTGSSKSGKSALIEVVNYCFGSGKCEVPEGPIRRAISWFGLRLQLAGGQAFIARRCPAPTSQSSEDCFVAMANEVTLPDHGELRQTTNTDGLIALLNQWNGIKENLHKPPPGHTRAALSAGVRHALLLCFQPQDEIIRRQQLFHQADDRYMADAIRDTLPYFLGAVDDNYVRRRAELRRLRDELRAVERQLSEMKNLRGDGISKAAGLLAQAREVGLTNALAASWEETIETLKVVARMPLSGVDPMEASESSGAELGRLLDERRLLREEQRRLREEIAAVQAVERDERGYATEAGEQRARLVSIGIFEGSGSGSHSCPLCAQALPVESAPPQVEQIRRELSEISSQLASVTRIAPQIVKAVAELEGCLQGVRTRVAKNRAEMEVVRGSSEALQKASDDETRRAYILGQIALYMESMPELPDSKNLEERAQQLRRQCEVLEELLSDERIQERLTSISTLLGNRMTEWSKKLLLEHSDAPLRLDLKKLTVIADTVDGPIPMIRMGSGENWVSYHLISHLALHEWFVKRNRPVPGFLFLDQPSQVYFPPERDVDGTLSSGKEEDRLAVIRMFRLVLDVVGELAPGLQVVITEHADIAEDWYQSAVAQRWRNGVKLVPEDWPRAT
ncbi:DUF3732 domain-containing protein [Nitrosospira sp. NRS527]|uniref:DUF3732 domain-containing protein n=1 Tax=Nitrosospira sp. NRS527 TaxID=155925 RepID=UPI001AF5618F|nr:DUF3732 domain-containing protein [Nitrosospira sp. NRS527]BCT67390.1 hypothetical protein NNRS527_00972 [Nitrosospira sp. NRS527]